MLLRLKIAWQIYNVSYKVITLKKDFDNMKHKGES